MSNTIEVLKRLKSEQSTYLIGNISVESETSKALSEALLGLEKLEAINLWVERDRVAQEKYSNIRRIIRGEINLNCIKEFLNKSGKVKKNE